MTAAAASFARDVRAVAWWVALGAGAGALAGIVIGGIGGRLVMLVLRETSPGAEGLTSDAGFEIGRVTLDGTLSLLAFAAVAGAAGGLAYVVARAGMPRAARVPAAALVGATLGGSAFLQPEGIDLVVLEPLWFAVAAFVLLPALAAAGTAVLVERLGRSGRAPAQVARIPAAARAAARLVVSGLVVLLVAVQGRELLGEVTTIL